MGRIIPVDIKDPFEQLPPGTFLLQVTGGGEGMIGKEGSEVYGLQVSHTVIEPKSCAGMEHDETFFIGVNDTTEAVKKGRLKSDPEANLDETWKARAGQFKRYCEKFDLNIEGADLDLVFQELTGKQIMAHVAHVVSKTLREDGTAFVNARADRWFKVGEAKPELELHTEPAQPARATAPGVGPRPGNGSATVAAPGPRPGGAPAPLAQAPGQPARQPLKRLTK